jgi:hypothetical protein
LIYSAKKSVLEIVVINNWLYVGNAKIDSKHIKKVTSLEKELGYKVEIDEVKKKFLIYFEDIFEAININK